MSEHSSNHSWNAGHGFKKDVSSEIFLLRHAVLSRCRSWIRPTEFSGFVMPVATDQVEAPSKKSDGIEGKAVTKVSSFAMSDLDRKHLLGGVDWMKPCCFGLLDMWGIGFGEEFLNLSSAVCGKLSVG